MRARAQGRGDGNRRVLAHHGRTSCPRGRYLSHRRCPRKVCRPWRNGLAPATAHDNDAFPHPARYGQRGGNTFTVGGARSTPAQCDRQRCPRGPSAASSAPCRLGGALRRGGAAGGAARPRIAPRGPGTAAGSAVTAGTSPAGRGSERGVGAAPGDSARRQPRSPAPQEQPGAVRRSLPGGWGQQRPGRRTASPRTSRVSPPAPPTSHLPVSPSLRVTPRCHPAPSVSPPPWVTRRAAAAPCRAGGRRGAPARRDTGGHGGTRRDTEGHGGTEGQRDAGCRPLTAGDEEPRLGVAVARRPRPVAPARCPPSPPYLEPNKPFRLLVPLCARSTGPHPPLPRVPRLRGPHRPTPGALQPPVH